MFVRSIALAALAAVSMSLVACAAEDGSEAAASNDSAIVTTAARPGGAIETFTGNDGKQYFRLVAANGLSLLRSEAYSGSPAATIQSLLQAAAENDARRFEVLEANGGGWYVDVKGAGASSEIIAVSEVYSSRSKAVAASKIMIGYLKGIGSAEYKPAETGKRFDLFELAADEKEMNGNQPFKFVLRADNGEAVLFSEAYSSKRAAEEGIKAVKDYGRLKVNYEVSEVERSGEQKGVFSLKAHEHSAVSETPGAPGNHESVGFSEVYSSKSNAQRGADAVRDLLQGNVAVNVR